MAAEVGKGSNETRARVETLSAWLKGKVVTAEGFSMLDYGGADGRFLPELPAKKYVYEISDIAPVSGVTRIENGHLLKSYSYVQLAQVLEHVSNPLEMVKEVSTRVNSGGYLYLEVPEDLDEAKISALVHREESRVPIHEHINFYNADSLCGLLEGAGLKILSVQPEILDIGWARAKIVRALGQKELSSR